MKMKRERCYKRSGKKIMDMGKSDAFLGQGGPPSDFVEQEKRAFISWEQRPNFEEDNIGEHKKQVNKPIYFVGTFFLSIFTGSLIYEHYTRECEFRNFDKIKNKKHKKTKQHKKTQKLLAEFLFK